MNGELNKPRVDPTLLSILSNPDPANDERMMTQNGINVSATTVKVNLNIVEDVEFTSPFLAITAPKSLK
jgi:hypothetical protein